MKKFILYLIGLSLVFGVCACSADTAETSVEATLSTDFAVEDIIPEGYSGEAILAEAVPVEGVDGVAVMEDINTNGWQHIEIPYSELPAEIQMYIDNFGSGDIENSTYLGSNDNYIEDSIITHAFNVNIDGEDTIVFASLFENGIEYDTAIDYDLAMADITGENIVSDVTDLGAISETEAE